jgi:type I restriction enzyme S subunit
MSRIDELIAEHCPEGVEFLSLGELLDYSQPGKYLVKSTAYDTSFNTPVLTAGQTFILGYTNEVEGIYRASSYEPVVIFDDFTTAFKWVDFDFKAKSSAMKMLTPKPGVNLRYVWFAMQTISYSPQDHARQWIGTYSQFRIPVPPLEVQRAIVEVLDAFSKLEAELEAELEARKQQYEHYKSGAFELSSETTQVPLGELVDLLQGFAFKSSMYVESGIRIVRISDVQKGAMSNKDLKYYPESAEDEIARYKLNTGDLVMSLSGSVGRVAMLAESDLPAVLNQRVACIRPNTPRVITRYLFHYLNTNHFEQEAIASTSGGTVKNLSSRWLKEILIPLPTIEAQERIVSILDKFDALVNDLSVGLPAELAARRQQYEYYRDKLLTFKELKVPA